MIIDYNLRKDILISLKYSTTLLLVSFFILMLLTIPSYADELVIIQSVSRTKKTFVIRKGRKEGIFVGQKSVFSTDKISIAATAINASRNFSIWVVSDQRVSIPFQSKNFVNYNRSVENIWSNISKLTEEIDKYRIKEIEKATYHSESEIKLLRRKGIYLIPEKTWVSRAYFSNTFSESTTQTNPSQIGQRSGYQIELLYSTKVKNKYDFALGGRYDQDSVQIKDPSLVIPTKRYYVIADFTYHFSNYSKESHIFSSLGIGYGISSTTISSEQAKGTSYILPFFRFGSETIMNEDLSFILDSTAEAISTTEKFSDGSKQTTNTISGKIGIGLRF